MSWARRRLAGALLGSLLLTGSLLLAAAAPAAADAPLVPIVQEPHTRSSARPTVTPLPTPRTISLRAEQAGAFTLYHLPAGKPWAVTKAGDGSLWFTLEEPAALLRLDPLRPETAQVYAVPAGMHPYLLTAGQGTSVWFTDFVYTAHPGPGHLVQVDPVAGQYRSYATPVDAGPAAAALAPDGAVWFTEFVAGGYGRLEPTTGELTEWLAPPSPEHKEPLPFGILPTAAGAWLVESGTNNLLQVSLAGLKASALRSPMPDRLWGPTDIQRSPTGDVFISAHGSNDILQITADGQRRVHALHPPAGPGVTNPSGIVFTPAGTWVAEHEGNRLALLRPDGNVVEFAQPQPESWSQWLQPAAGGIWYAAYHTDTIGFLPTTALPAVQLQGSTAGTALRQGGHAQVALTATQPASAQGPVTLDLHVDRLPDGVQAQVQPAQVTLAPGQSAQATVTLQGAGDAEQGDFRLLLSAYVGGQQLQVSQGHALTVRSGFLGLAWASWGVVLALVLLAVAIIVRLLALRRR